MDNEKYSNRRDTDSQPPYTSLGTATRLEEIASRLEEMRKRLKTSEVFLELEELDLWDL